MYTVIRAPRLGLAVPCLGMKDEGGIKPPLQADPCRVTVISCSRQQHSCFVQLQLTIEKEPGLPAGEISVQYLVSSLKGWLTIQLGLEYEHFQLALLPVFCPFRHRRVHLTHGQVMSSCAY